MILNPRFWASVVLISLNLLIPVFSQNSSDINLRLALEFYHEEDYEKSIGLLEDVYKSNQGIAVYTPLIQSYLALKDYDKAEKIIRKKLKQHPFDPLFLVDHGYVLIESGAQKKGESVYKDAIKKVHPNTQDIIALSNNFQRVKAIDYAIQTLIRGEKLTPGYGYQFELGELYYQQGNTEAMIDEYLDLLALNRGYLQNVQNALNTTIYQDLNKTSLAVLNRALLKRIQKNPDEIIFAEMLIWHFLQQKDFESAYVQTKALDQRRNEGGKRMETLGNLCLSNKQYDLAMKCFQYLIDFGPSSNMYIGARVMMTQTIQAKIISAPYTQSDLLVLEENYLKTLKEIGTVRATINLQIGLAELWAQRLDKGPEAIDMLTHALSSYQLRQEQEARVKLTLADIYLGEDEIWEASLLYSQVEKDFKYDELGDEAKFKNAKVYFYTGDYKWAKAQLDVLKGSTSKLIANDALRLSLLISDNIAFDTVGEAIQLYAKATLFYDQKKLDQALQLLDSMSNIYMVHNLMDEILFLQYQIFFQQQDFASCEKNLSRIVSNFSNDILADEALFRLAELYDYHLPDVEKAKKSYKDLMANYPASIFVVKARDRYRNLRGDELN